MTAEAKTRTLSYDEWQAEGTALFGDNVLRWRFVCPSCGHIQTIGDFRQYKDQGATPDSARQVCIGRFDGHMDVPMSSGASPCNYAAYGLLHLCPIIVLHEGKELQCFDFDREGAQRSSEGGTPSAEARSRSA